MSNPTNLQELADSLARSAEFQLLQAAEEGATNYRAGYREALLDTRATVLAMIAEGVGRPVFAMPATDAMIESLGSCPTCGAAYGEMDHDPEPCEPLCPECGCVVSDHHEACSQRLVEDGTTTVTEVESGPTEDDDDDDDDDDEGGVVLAVLPVQGVTDLRAALNAFDEVNNASPAVVGALNESLAGTDLHKASPDPDYAYLCTHCMLNIKQVPGGNGTVWVHEGTGMVVGRLT